MPTIKQAIDRLKNLEGRNDEVIVAMTLWQVGDIMSRANDTGHEINEEEAKRILNQLDHNQDCSMGINWDVIDEHIFSFCYARDEGVNHG